MPYDANGNYTLPGSYFVETGDTVLPSQHNPPFQDISQALNNVLLRNGVAPMGDDLNMGAFRILNLADGQNAQDAVTKKQLDAYSSRAVRIGSIFMVVGNVPPAGSLKANGALVSRTTYAALWAYAQVSGALAASDAAWSSSAQFGLFSPGDGSTTFRLPDFRGYFPRAWDDGRGLDAGRAIGAAQATQNASHAHGVNDPSHAHAVYDPGHGHSLGWGGNSNGSGYPVLSDGLTQNIGTSINGTGIGIYGAATGISIQASGGNESRPVNLSVLFCIQFQG